MFHSTSIGLPIDHPASFRKYLLERLIRPAGILDYHLLDGEGDPAVVARSVGDALRKAPIDVAFVGIGENGHLAFNDPPADFVTESPYLIVRLDALPPAAGGRGLVREHHRCAGNCDLDVGETNPGGERDLCVVPDRRKAEAVRACLEGPVTPNAPASILRTHRDVTIYPDPDSASLLSRDLVSRGSAPVAEDLWRVPTVGESS